MGRATVNGLVFPPPTVNGVPTASGSAGTSGVFGERNIKPHLTPTSWLGRIMCPVPRFDFHVTAGFYLHPVNQRAGGPDV